MRSISWTAILPFTVKRILISGTFWHRTARYRIPVGHTFPLLTHDSGGAWSLIGTGFYIGGGGLFVTAGHVIREVLQGTEQIKPLCILHVGLSRALFGGDGYLLRRIDQCWVGESADIALGLAGVYTNNETGQALQNHFYGVNWTVPAVGAPTATYAFPNHALRVEAERQIASFTPAAYIGHVLEVGDFRDRMNLPFPYLNVDFRIHGGASGGPVLHDGSVVGVNCSEIHPSGPGYGTQIRCLQDAVLNNVILPGEKSGRTVRFTDLVQTGWVSASNFKPDAISRQAGTVVRLGQVLPQAVPPMLELMLPS